MTDTGCSTDRDQLREKIAAEILNRRGFGFYLDPMEGGQDAYDLSIDALEEADAIIALIPSVAQAKPDRDKLAETIHNARWPADRQLAVTPFADEDRNGREYCYRIADAVLAQGFHLAYTAKEPDAEVKALADKIESFEDVVLETDDGEWSDRDRLTESERDILLEYLRATPLTSTDLSSPSENK